MRRVGVHFMLSQVEAREVKTNYLWSNYCFGSRLVCWTCYYAHVLFGVVAIYRSNIAADQTHDRCLVVLPF